MFSWEYSILRTLLRHKAGSLQDTVIIQLGLAVLFSFGRSFGHQLSASIFPQCTFARAKAIRAPSIQTDRLMTSSQ